MAEANTVAALQQRIAELERDRALLFALLDSLPFYVYTKDADGSMRFSNAPHLRSMGYTDRAAVIGKTDRDLFPEEGEVFSAEDQRVIHEEQPLADHEEWVTRPNGEQRLHLTHKHAVYDADGLPIGLYGITRDITEERANEQEAERAMARAAAQQQIIQELATPIIPISDDIIIMPLIGEIDSQRAYAILRALLAGISQQNARVVIIDLTGVMVIDSAVAAHLDRTIRAAQLKGAHAIVTGISETIAEMVVDLGIDWSALDTHRDLSSGLTAALTYLDKRLR